MPLPQTKVNELMDILIPYVDAGEVINEFRLASIRRDINKLPFLEDKLQLQALCYAASGDVANAKQYFQRAFELYPDVVIAQNYRTYINQQHDYPLVVSLTYMYAGMFEEPKFVKEAYDTSLFFEHDLVKANVYLEKYLKYLPEEHRMAATEEYKNEKESVLNMLSVIGLSEDVLPLISSLGHSIARDNNIGLIRNNLYLHENLLAVEFEVEKKYSSRLSDVNFKLAMHIAEDETLFDKPLTALFRTTNDNVAPDEHVGA
ncbi:MULTISPECIES: hypothetical protein [Aeromonas]|uniref:hypothetical protein n=1 Tax=Aeromonas TaxID=642 RepID=UPI00191F52B9|nr:MULTISPECIES: hypothetical protein [Aeromonas]MBL0628707.1 hypothetical protein [Aeromonas jandaei]